MSDEPIDYATLEFHELADMFPLLTDTAGERGEDPATGSLKHGELTNLIESIERLGLLQKITLFEGKILDGRNRFIACQIMGREWSKSDFWIFDPKKDGDPVDFVISRNLERRNLTKGQKAGLATELYDVLGKQKTEQDIVKDGRIQRLFSAPKFEEWREAAAKRAVFAVEYYETLAKRKMGRPSHDGGIQTLIEPAEERRKRVCAMYGVSIDAFKQAAKVAKAAPEEAEKVKAGKQTLHKAAKIADRAAAGAAMDEAMITIAEFDPKLARAIHSEEIEGLKKSKDLLAFAGLSNATKRSITPALRKGWTLKKALRFADAVIDERIGPRSLAWVIDYFNFTCLDKLVFDLGGVRFTLTPEEKMSAEERHKRGLSAAARSEELKK